MNLRSIGTQGFGAAVILASAVLNSNAQVASRAQASSASHVAAEMTKGKLNPAESKPGDTVAVKLKDDLRSNGQVVLKKGTTITGVVRNVKRSDANGAVKGEGKSQAQSMMEIEWLVPASQGRRAQNVSVALESVMQVDLPYQQNESAADDFGFASNGAATAVARPARGNGSGGGLLGGVGGVVGGAASTAGAVTSTASTNTSGKSNEALLKMPSVVAADHQTSSEIESTLGTSSSGQLFKVGHGDVVTAGGSKQSVDIFSHLSNDTVITSPSKNFEISSGAQMQMLFGVKK